MEFGVTFQANPPVSQVVDWTRIAEEQGFEYAWLWDSHVLWQEVYPIFTLMAQATSTIKMGPCVTNPATRDPTVTASVLATLNEISGGRMVMGIGRGDSARRVIGQTPVTVEHMIEAAQRIRDLAAGRPIDYDGTPLTLKWSQGHEVEVWMAAYGPKALRAVGQVADGLIMQLADPYIIEWALPYVREGAEAAGRRFEDIKIMSAAPAYVSEDLAHARDQVRWFPALVSNHVVDLVNRYSTGLPQELTDYIAARKAYDYAHHGEVGSSNAEFVTDEVVDRFCVIGPLEECRRKLQELESLGVDQFNIYDMGDNVVETMQTFGKELIPALRKGAMT